MNDVPNTQRRTLSTAIPTGYFRQSGPLGPSLNITGGKYPASEFFWGAAKRPGLSQKGHFTINCSASEKPESPYTAKFQFKSVSPSGFDIFVLTARTAPTLDSVDTLEFP